MEYVQDGEKRIAKLAVGGEVSTGGWRDKKQHLIFALIGVCCFAVLLFCWSLASGDENRTAPRTVLKSGQLWLTSIARQEVKVEHLKGRGQKERRQKVCHGVPSSTISRLLGRELYSPTPSLNALLLQLEMLPDPFILASSHPFFLSSAHALARFFWRVELSALPRY